MQGTGPWIATAVICDQVLQEADGVFSAIRMVDRLTQSASGPAVPENMPPVTVNRKLLVTLKADKARGRHKVLLRPEKPSGEKMATIDMPVHFEGEERGVTLVVELQLALDEEGLYWFDLYLERSDEDGDDVLLTRVPLRLVYQPRTLTAS
jgi:hypothetical protein